VGRPAAPAPSVPASSRAVAPGLAPMTGPLVYQFAFHGRLGTLLGIYLVNSLLALLTLGLYQFWGRTRVRRYVLSETALAGDRFSYHGTGSEVCAGFLKAFGIFVLPATVLFAVAALESLPVATRLGAQLLAYAIVTIFVALAIVGSHRYRLGRTSLRGVRFSFRGRTADFARLFIVGAVLTAATLGLYRPIFDTRLRAFLVGHSYLGSRQFEFDGRSRDLFWPYVRALVMLVPTLGLSTVWYLAAKQRYFWRHTRLGSARCQSAVTGGRLLGLVLGNLSLLGLTAALGAGPGLWAGLGLGLAWGQAVGLAISLGLATLLVLGWPWVKLRSVRFTVATLSVVGSLDLAAIVQEAQAASGFGEALAGFFDVGFDLG
jgi:uncharacterized membrane protein YjgN (DUF898 family)